MPSVSSPDGPYATCVTVEKRVPSPFQNFDINLVPKYRFSWHLFWQRVKKLWKLQHSLLIMSPPLVLFFSLDVPFFAHCNGFLLSRQQTSNLQNKYHIKHVWAQLMVVSACFPSWDWSTFCCVPAERERICMETKEDEWHLHVNDWIH